MASRERNGSRSLSTRSSHHITRGQGKNTIDPRIERGCEREDIVFFWLGFFVWKRRKRSMLCCFVFGR